MTPSVSHASDVESLMGTRTGLAVLAATCALGLLSGIPAARADRATAAGGADTITSSGRCSAGASWTMGARAQRRGILVAVRVQSAPWQRWRIVLRHNGTPVMLTVRGTGPRGVATVKRRTPNLPGVDTYTVVARNRAGQETCTGALAY